MTIKYRTVRYKNTIQAFKVIKETKHFITFKNHIRGVEEREARRSEYQQWFDTWGEAQGYLYSREQGKQRMCQIQLEKIEHALEEIRKLEPVEKPE